MKLSAKTDYALRAILELSLHWPKIEPVSLNVIAKKQQIPIKFLSHILLHLKDIGLVHSTRGKEGGYLLAKSPAKITMADIFIYGVDYGFRKRGEKSKKEYICHAILEELDEKLKVLMKELTFEMIIQRERAKEKVPMYTI